MRDAVRVVVISIALAMLSAGCYRTRPVAVSALPPMPRVRLQAREGFRFVPMDSSGVLGAETCTARRLTARLTKVRPDTLVLGEIEVIGMDGGSVTCRRALSAAVVPSENRALRIGVIEATPRRAFAAGLFTGSGALILFFLWIIVSHPDG